MIFFDLDGVLAIYTPEDYQGNPMPFEIPNTHYFKHRARDPHALVLLIQLAHTLDDPQLIAMLTTLSRGAQRDSDLAVEHRFDKQLWLNHLLDDAGLPHFPLLFSKQGTLPKAEVVEQTLKRPLTSTDILIDDFNANLESWTEHGGTGIKYLNGLNSAESWSGILVCPSNIDYIVSLITCDILKNY